MKDAYCGRGLAHHAKEEYGLAIADFTDAAPFFLTSGFISRAISSHCYRGLVNCSKGEYDLAIADFETAIRMSRAPAQLYSEIRQKLDRAARVEENPESGQ